MDVGVACSELYPLRLRAVLTAHAFSFVRHGLELERGRESERRRRVERSERSESPRKFSSHDEVNQIAIAAIAQLPECGALSLAGGAAAVGCVMVISTGPNEAGAEQQNGSDFPYF